MIKRIMSSFKYAINGLQTVWKEEQNFRIEIVVALLVLIFAIYFNFSFPEIVLCIIAILFVICGEIVNTAIEDLCDKIGPNQDETIGKIKDIMAGFVLVSSLGAVVIGVLVFYSHFFK